MPAVEPVTVGISLDHDRLGVVEQNVTWDAVEVRERLAYARAQRFGGLVGGEADETGPAVAQGRNERQQWLPAAADNGEVSLHLLAWRRLEADHWIPPRHLVRTDEQLHLRQATNVAAF